MISVFFIDVLVKNHSDDGKSIKTALKVITINSIDCFSHLNIEL